MDRKRVTLFTGFFGSGKTEIALNYAIYQRQGVKPEVKTWAEGKVPLMEIPTDHDVALVDLDLVNPYFRSQEAKEILENQGVKTHIPPDEWRGGDLPVLVSGAFAALAAKTGRVVVDLGGDDQGVLTLGQFRPFLKAEEYNFWLVINPFRPFNEDVASILETCRRIEAASQLRLTGLISNPNLGRDTTMETISQGHAVVLAAAEAAQLPVEALVIWDRLLATMHLEHLHTLPVARKVPLLPVSLYLYPEWLEA